MGSQASIYDVKINLSKKNKKDLKGIKQSRLNLITSWKKPQIVLLDKNKLTCLNEDVLNIVVSTPSWIEHLTEINLSYNELETFPAAFFQLVNLTVLKLSHNQIRVLPEGVGNNFYQLRILNIEDNHIVTLPWNLGRLGCLTTLNLDKNYLKYIPNSIGRLEELQALSFDDNPLDEMQPMDESVVFNLDDVLDWVGVHPVPAKYKKDYLKSLTKQEDKKKDELLFMELLYIKQTRETFYQHMKKEYSQENLEFWVEANDFARKYNALDHAITTVQLIEEATKIFNTYLSEESQKTVNLPAEDFSELQKAFTDQFVYPRGINQWTFLKACESAFRNMYTDTFARFRHTESGKEAIAITEKVLEQEREIIQS